MANAAVTASDRFTFTLFLAGVLHAVLILGLGFTAPRVERPHVMEVTLAQHQARGPVRNADFLAQADQEGSGTAAEARLLASPHQARFHDDVIREIQPQEAQAAARAQAEARQAVVTTRGRSRATPLDESREPEPETVEAQEGKLARAVFSNDIASLEARLAERRQAYAKRPKIRTVSSVSTRRDRDATYVEAFRRKIELVGNLHYPEQARDRHLTGNVRLLVAIKADGRVDQVTVLKSSGQRLLDDAAKQSVRLAAPFQPFPATIRRDTDILQIIRTWKFAETLTSEA